MPKPDGKPTTTERGYGAEHVKARKAVAVLVDRGQAMCCRCWRPIVPGTPWDLDHNDTRTGYRGPAHRSCNRRAGQAVSARRRNRRQFIRLIVSGSL